jgi:hypothetical protein
MKKNPGRLNPEMDPKNGLQRFFLFKNEPQKTRFGVIWKNVEVNFSQLFQQFPKHRSKNTFDLTTVAFEVHNINDS